MLSSHLMFAYSKTKYLVVKKKKLEHVTVSFKLFVILKELK